MQRDAVPFTHCQSSESIDFIRLFWSCVLAVDAASAHTRRGCSIAAPACVAPLRGRLRSPDNMVDHLKRWRRSAKDALAKQRMSLTPIPEKLLAVARRLPKTCSTS
jgi:hypothetical protein